jgi:O-antigen/teichoic acid export membrane protein
MGEEWVAMVPAMQALSLWGLMRSLGPTTSPVFQAMGRPRITAQTQLIQVIVLAFAIYPLAQRWDILGVSLSVVVSGFVANTYRVWAVVRELHCGLRDLCARVLPPVVHTVVTILLILTVKSWLGEVGTLQFILLASSGLLVYLSATYLSDRYLGYGMRSLVSESLSSVWKAAE